MLSVQSQSPAGGSSVVTMSIQSLSPVGGGGVVSRVSPSGWRWQCSQSSLSLQLEVAMLSVQSLSPAGGGSAHDDILLQNSTILAFM